YNADGGIDKEILNNNNATYKKANQFSYADPRGRLTSISSSLFTEALTYTAGSFDNSGYYNNSIASDSFYYPGNPLPTHKMKFRYDNLGRLLIADIDNSTYNTSDLGVNSSGSADPITYDPNGNIMTVNRHASIGSTYTYWSGTNKVRWTTGSTDQYTYDQNANITQSTPKSLNTITYDAFTQLTMSVTTAANGTISFEYDGRKERILKKVTNGSTTSTLYLRGLNEYPLTEKTNSGTSRQYVYGPTGLIACIDNGTNYYMLKDHLGSTRAVMNGSNGTGVEYHAYDAWGAVMAEVVSPDIKYKFTGQELDGQTGIYNYRARMYDQSLGRFYAMDPAGEAFAPFGYAGNNAISFIDPRGMKQGPHDPRIPGPGFSGHIYVLGVDVPIHSSQTIPSGAGGFGFSYDASYGAGEAYFAGVLGGIGIQSDGYGGYTVGSVHIQYNGESQVINQGNGGGYYQYVSVTSGDIYTINSKGEIVMTGQPTTSGYWEWVGPPQGGYVGQSAVNAIRGALDWLDDLTGNHIPGIVKDILSTGAMGGARSSSPHRWKNTSFC
ncbi:MAG: RHS repeat-associated core domain-containing protein, partial [Ignavibacteriales bacterium]|nr:RHS repeat-associated core domain-containing protein [Ignavibacteriales bacterium]